MRHRRRTRIEGQFAPRLVDMLRSPAMAALSLSARRILDRLEIELADHGGKENGRLPCTFEDFRRFGIDRDSIAPALRELIALGFVERTEAGRAGNREFRQPNQFRLTYRHTEYANSTDEWEKIKTEEVATAIAGEARRAKTKTNRGKPHASVRKSPTEALGRPLGKPPTTALVRETPTTLDISGRGTDKTSTVDVALTQRSAGQIEPSGSLSATAAAQPRADSTSQTAPTQETTP